MIGLAMLANGQPPYAKTSSYPQPVDSKTPSQTDKPHFHAYAMGRQHAKGVGHGQLANPPTTYWPVTREERTRQLSELIDTDTDEITEQLSADAARILVNQIRAGLDALRDAVLTLWRGQGWLALGYPTWVEMCAAEFPFRLALTREDRRELVS